MQLNIITVIEGQEFGVDLREVHRALESQREFSHWAKAKLSQFVENQDYVSDDKFVAREVGASRRIDYYCSLDVAKHIALMENTEKGRQIRSYFIEIEKRYSRGESLNSSNTMSLEEIIRKKVDEYGKTWKGDKGALKLMIEFLNGEGDAATSAVARAEMVEFWQAMFEKAPQSVVTRDTVFSCWEVWNREQSKACKYTTTATLSKELMKRMPQLEKDSVRVNCADGVKRSVFRGWRVKDGVRPTNRMNLADDVDAGIIG